MKILRWAPFRTASGQARGFVDIETPSGMAIRSLRLMIGPKGPWVAMPSAKRVDSDGRSVPGADGKPAYDEFVGFRDRATRDRFQELILAALRAAHPDAFDGML